MCGISGIINQNNHVVIKSEIKSMNDLIIHRGPDDEGIYLDKSLAFGHRRLSIIDLSKDGHQPMPWKELFVITYNGEVYNYLELKKELIADGYQFNSDSDTEVILASYHKWGEDCVTKFNGMWAFAIHDKQKNTVFCSRDRFGIKPFYYAQINNQFVFGSEIKQLLPFFDRVKANKKILLDYLVLGLEEHTNDTFFSGVSKLEQSHNLVYDLSMNSFEIKKYYELKKIKNGKESFETLFTDSVKLRLRSDVAVGSCLSGGLDSSSIAAIAAKNYYGEKKLSVFHAKATENKKDESLQAKEVSDFCDLNLKITEPSVDDFRCQIDEVIYTQEEPFATPSIFMQYFVMSMAKKNNCKVLLDGQGADETLLGYERYYPSYLIELGFSKRMIVELLKMTKNSKLSFKSLVLYTLYFTQSKIRLRRLIKKFPFVKKELLSSLSYEQLKENAIKYKNIFDLQHMEISKTQLPHLLKYEDKNSMRHSIETRLPFLDFRLVELSLSLDFDKKINNGWTKYILRQTADSLLPKNIVWRREKFGFESPTEKWVKSIMSDIEKAIFESDLIQSICSNINLNKLDNNQKWKLYNIARWEQLYKVQA